MATLAPTSRQGLNDECLVAFQPAYDASPAAPALAENDRLLDLCESLAEQIPAIRPTTLAGLAACAKVACYDGFSPGLLAKDRADLDDHQFTVLDFLDLVEALTRVAHT